MARSMQVDVANTPKAVATARQAIADAVEAWGIGGPHDGAIVDDLLLVTTELLSNAVKFSSGAVTMLLTWRSGVLRVTVTDNAPSPATLRSPGPHASGGRGLAIVAALSSRWGQTPYADGCKEVWAEVLVASRSGAGASGRTTATLILEG